LVQGLQVCHGLWHFQNTACWGWKCL